MNLNAVINEPPGYEMSPVPVSAFRPAAAETLPVYAFGGFAYSHSGGLIGASTFPGFRKVSDKKHLSGAADHDAPGGGLFVRSAANTANWTSL